MIICRNDNHLKITVTIVTYYGFCKVKTLTICRNVSSKIMCYRHLGFLCETCVEYLVYWQSDHFLRLKELCITYYDCKLLRKRDQTSKNESNADTTYDLTVMASVPTSVTPIENHVFHWYTCDMLWIYTSWKWCMLTFVHFKIHAMLPCCIYHDLHTATKLVDIYLFCYLQQFQ